MSSNGSNRVVIIGLDGATYRVLDPMRAAGAMPNISRLRESGAWGHLRSTTPTNSAAAWVSFMTGKNPAKHGVFEFQVRSTPAGPKRVAGYHNIAGETLWDAVSREGKKVVGINVPIAYPATPVNGAMVSGIPIPSGSRSWTYPEGLADEIDRETDGYVISLPWRDVQGRADPFLARLSEMTHKRARATRYLMERYEPDLMTVVFVGPIGSNTASGSISTQAIQTIGKMSRPPTVARLRTTSISWTTRLGSYSKAFLPTQM